MSGAAANKIGLGIASYKWMAAITLVGVAFIFLPKFLKCGIYTIPEFLEYRYDKPSRLAMAILTLVILVMIPASSVIFAGAKFISEYYTNVTLLNNLVFCCWLIAVLAAGYVFIGGLKSCTWTDLVWGSALILGGGIVAYFAFKTLSTADPATLVKTTTSNVRVDEIKNANALERLFLLNQGSASEGGKLHMVRHIDDPTIPWTALVLALWSGMGVIILTVILYIIFW